MQKFIVSAFAFSLFAFNAEAASYYVAPNGNDAAAGTKTAPWKTMQKAASYLIAGDTVFVRAGSYTGTVEPSRSGVAGKFITYAAYPGEEQKVILNGGSSKFSLKGKSYIEIRGFKVSNVSGNAIDITGPGSNIVVSGNWLYNAKSSCVGAWGVGWQVDPIKYSYRGLTAITVKDNKFQKCVNGGWNEQVTVANGVDGVIITGNEFFDQGSTANGGEVIDLKAGVKNAKIYRNKIHGTSLIGIYVDAAGTNGYYSTRPVMSGIEIYENEIWDHRGTAIQISTEGKGNVDGVKIYNNIISNVGQHGILVYRHPSAAQWGGGSAGTVKNVKIYNNTVYGANDYGLLVNSPGSSNITVRNNISYKSGTNLLIQTLTSGLVNTHNFLTDPLFINPIGRNFRLKSTSNVLRKGSTTDYAPKDFDQRTRNPSMGIDPGAFQYSTSTVQATPPATTTTVAVQTQAPAPVPTASVTAGAPTRTKPLRVPKVSKENGRLVPVRP